jgi:hypothetical protein
LKPRVWHELPWWERILLVLGLLLLVGVLGALFLPDWTQSRNLSTTLDAPAGSPAFVQAVAG